MMNAVARPPTRICPSPPTFQNRMRKAGASASATHRRIIVSRTVVQMEMARFFHARSGVPNVVWNIVAKTSSGFRPVNSTIVSEQTASASSTATA